MRRRIALIGAGWGTKYHLDTYRKLADRVIKGVDAIRQPCFLERPLLPEVARLTKHLPMNASEALDCDHLTMRSRRTCDYRLSNSLLFLVPKRRARATRNFVRFGPEAETPDL